MMRSAIIAAAPRLSLLGFASQSRHQLDVRTRRLPNCEESVVGWSTGNAADAVGTEQHYVVNACCNSYKLHVTAGPVMMAVIPYMRGSIIRAHRAGP